LGFGSLIAPDQSWTDDFVIFIEQDGAVHLAGESDGGDGFGGEARGLEGFANRQCGGAPPVARILLRPAGRGTGEVGVLFRARRKDRAVFFEEDGAGSAGSDVDAEDGDTASFLSQSCARVARDAVSDSRLVRERISSRKQAKPALSGCVNVHGDI
jgi:hypothetical protein